MLKRRRYVEIITELGLLNFFVLCLKLQTILGYYHVQANVRSIEFFYTKL